jgi:hypothetical protein
VRCIRTGNVSSEFEDLVQNFQNMASLVGKSHEMEANRWGGVGGGGLTGGESSPCMCPFTRATTELGSPSSPDGP